MEDARVLLVPDVLTALLEGHAATVLVVVAHPDDETVGAGGLLAGVPDVRVLTVTDGAPLPDGRADALDDPRRILLAETRRRELVGALSLAGVGTERIATLDLPAHSAHTRIPTIAVAVRDAVLAHGAGVILTHAYEGGHPDHDAVAVAVHAAAAMVRREVLIAPSIVEMALYHGDAGGLVVQRFLGDPGLVRILSAAERSRKRRMLACHRSQQAALSAFGVEVERFRLAPAYDFFRPPHPGPLFYERGGGTVDGETFRAAVRAAAEELGLGAPPWR